MRRVRKHLTTVKAKLLYNAFILHASIFWMFCHKRDYLNIVSNSNESCEVLLLRKNEVSVYQKQLRILDTEVFKSLADINPDFMKSYFAIKEILYCLWDWNFLKIPSARSTSYAANSILFRACLVWNKLPFSVKQSQSLIELKSKIKVLEKWTAPVKFAVYNFMGNSD